jgi:hypothetical protein
MLKIIWKSILSLSLLVVLQGRLLAAPPTLTGTSPAGVMVGKTTELTFQGANLAGTPQIISPLPIQFEKSENKDAGKWVVKVTLPDDAPLGVFPVRLATAKGVTNPVLLAVDQVPTVNEVEPNNKTGVATAVPSPVVVEGQSANNDVDFIRFPGRKGQIIVVDAAAARVGSALDPTIRLTTVSGKFVASADDTPGLATDARFITTLPEDGDYFLELSDTNYKGTGRANYRVTIGSVPMAEEVFPLVLSPDVTNALELRGGTIAPDKSVIRLAAVPKSLDPFDLLSLDIPATAIGVNAAAFDATMRIQWPYRLIETSVPQVVESDKPASRRPSAPVAFLGRMEQINDEDRFDLAVDAGAKYRVKVEAGRIGSAMDAVLRVLGADGKQIATADDSPLKVPNPPANTPPFTQPDPELEFTAPAGQNVATLAIKDISNRGGLGFHYRILVEKSVPEFDISLPAAQLNIPAGQNALVNVAVDRTRGYAGPVKLELVNPPAGVKFRPGLVPAGAAAGLISISVDAGAKLPPTFLTIEGKGDGGLSARSASSITFASQGPLPVNVLRQSGFIAVSADAAPVGLEVADAAVEVAHGFEGAIPLKISRGTGGEPALDLALVNPPKGLTLGTAKAAEKLADLAVVVKAALDTPVGEHQIGLTAKGKLGGEDRVVESPVIKLNVVPPVALSGLPKEATVKPGATLEVKGKLARKPSMKGEITVTADGLPAGLKADPVKVPATSSDFTIKITADKAAKAATGNATVKAAFKAGDKDYPALTSPVAIKIVP